MKINKYKKGNRIALISIAAAALMACSPVTAFAAVSTPADDTVTRVIYTGNGTAASVEVKNPVNYINLMPGGSTNMKSITIENPSSKDMLVYFQAQPADTTSQNLLNALKLTVKFKMDDKSDVQTLYEGLASGQTGTTAVNDIVSKQICLGKVYANSVSGVISATLTAPETMGNAYQNAGADIKWVLQFQLADPINSIPYNYGGGGGGGGGGGTVAQPVVSIAPESTPQGGPSVSSKPTEEIPNENVPLSTPKTGQDPVYIWIILAIALIACIVIVAAQNKIKHQANNR